MIYEARALIFALHHDGRFLKVEDAVARTERAFERLIAAHLANPVLDAA
jgi:hypothetical protein